MTEQFDVGTRLTGKINNVTDLGIFVTFDKKHSGLIHHSDFLNFQKDRHNYQKGQEIRVVITKIKDDKLSLSISRLNDENLIDSTNRFSETKTKDFYRVLGETLDQATEKIEKLKQKTDGR